MSLPKLTPARRWNEWDITVLEEGNHRKIDMAHIDGKSEIGKAGDYSSSDPELNMFEARFYIGGREYCGVEECLMKYELSDEYDNSNRLNLEFRVPEGTGVDLYDLFTEHGRLDISVFRVSRTGEFTAMRTFGDCRMASHRKVHKDGDTSSPYRMEAFGFSFEE